MGKIGKDKSVGVSTRFPHNDPTKGGRKPSIRRQLNELLEQDGKVKINAKQVISIEEDGSTSSGIQIKNIINLGFTIGF